MEKKGISFFEIVLIGIFVLAVVFAVLIFGGFLGGGKSGLMTGPQKGGQSQEEKIKFVLWGIIENRKILPFIKKFNESNSLYNLNYIQKNPEKLRQELVEAIANFQSPDFILVDNETILSIADKIAPISPFILSKEIFSSLFVSGADIFYSQEGALGLPLLADPLLIYYNRLILDSAGVDVPKTWDDLKKIAILATKKDENFEIIRSGVAFGGFDNIKNAEYILSTLFLQSGNPVFVNGQSTLSNLSTSQEALEFYLSFIDPSKENYSWKKSLPDSREMFLKDDLAIYFDFASSLFDIKDENPNLNFNISQVPQKPNEKFPTTFAKMYALVMIRNSSQLNKANQFIASILNNNQFFIDFSKTFSLPSLKRNILLMGPSEYYLKIFFDSALISKSFFVKDAQKTRNSFREMIDNLLRNKLAVPEALQSFE